MQNSSHIEKLVSGLGGFISIFTMFWITTYFEQILNAHTLFVASMGASAVLLFAAPRGPLSQPWNVIGGHLVSAFVGVSVHLLVPFPILAGALAVGIAISSMYYLSCLHPPGGATALVAVIGGSATESFGFLYVLFPIGLGALSMTVIAILFNYPFKWRRYPASLEAASTTPPHNPAFPQLTHKDIQFALQEIDGFEDISEQDLLKIYELAAARNLNGSNTAKPATGALSVAGK